MKLGAVNQARQPGKEKLRVSLVSGIHPLIITRTENRISYLSMMQNSTENLARVFNLQGQHSIPEIMNLAFAVFTFNPTFLQACLPILIFFNSLLSSRDHKRIQDHQNSIANIR